MSRHTFKHQAAQGDVLFRKIDGLPDGVRPAKAEVDGRFIVGHSETGHHHVVGVEDHASRVAFYESPTDPLRGYLVVTGTYAYAQHLRGWDTHDTLHIEPGTYEVIRQRERAPEGWRQVVD